MGELPAAASEELEGWDESDSLDSEPSSGQDVGWPGTAGDVVEPPSALGPEKLDGNWWLWVKRTCQNLLVIPTFCLDETLLLIKTPS